MVSNESAKTQVWTLDASRRARRYFPVNATELLPKLILDGLPDQAEFEALVGGLLGQAAETSKNGFVFAFGELVAELCASKNPVGAVRMEKLWNELARTSQFSLYCAYPLAVVTSEPTLGAIFDICAEHSITIPAETSL
jgi:hypothetical protein